MHMSAYPSTCSIVFLIVDLELVIIGNWQTTGGALAGDHTLVLGVQSGDLSRPYIPEARGVTSCACDS